VDEIMLLYRADLGKQALTVEGSSRWVPAAWKVVEVRAEAA